MGVETGIEWCDHTWNPWRGCTKISPACDHCYAADLAKRNPLVLGEWGDDGTRTGAAENYWHLPYKWDAAARKAGVRRKVFLASMADIFEDWKGFILDVRGRIIWVDTVNDLWLADDGTPGFVFDKRLLNANDLRTRAFRIIRETTNLDYLLLTKRTKNVRPMASEALGWDVWLEGMPSNCWLGCTVESQEWAWRIDDIVKIGAPVSFVSYEPALGPIDWSPYLDQPSGPKFDWLIAGGESGPSARPSYIEWFRTARDKCLAANVAFFFKQWGEWMTPGQAIPCISDVINDRPEMFFDSNGRDVTHEPLFHGPVTLTRRIGKKHSGSKLDGRTHQQFPEPR
ncbi:DUF5131 family protein [Singulisphaera rosea]